MGLSINAQENSNGDYVKSVEQMCQIVINRARIPYKRFNLFYSFTKDHKKQTEAIKIIDSFFYDIIRTRKKNITDNGMTYNKENQLKSVFLDLLLKFYEDDTFTLNDVKDEVNSFLFGVSVQVLYKL